MLEKGKSLWEEFKGFALKGNVIELAIAVLVGTAFSGVVNSLATDILGPFISLATNSVDFKTLSYELRPDLVIKYGAFLQTLFNFLIITLSIFVIIKLFKVLRPRRFSRKADQ
jgi:large conductance mechanosensitive channel